MWTLLIPWPRNTGNYNWSPVKNISRLLICLFRITNGAVHAKHVVVMAQLLVEGKNEGIHALLVRMRDNDLKTIPGVTIEDMGYKMGLNGVDNAKLR